MYNVIASAYLPSEKTAFALSFNSSTLKHLSKKNYVFHLPELSCGNIRKILSLQSKNIYMEHNKMVVNTTTSAKIGMYWSSNWCNTVSCTKIQLKTFYDREFRKFPFCFQHTLGKLVRELGYKIRVTTLRVNMDAGKAGSENNTLIHPPASYLQPHPHSCESTKTRISWLQWPGYGETQNTVKIAASSYLHWANTWN